MNVFKLDKIYEDPRFEGFSFADKKSLLGRLDLYADFNMLGSNGEASRLARLWRPRKVVGNVRAMNDFPTVDQIPAFSHGAVDALRDLLESNGELLALAVPAKLGNYYAYNTTTIESALDTEKSEIGTIRIRRHEFFTDRLVGLSIFRIPEKPSVVYVTDVFAERVRKHNLHGFHLMKVWPLPEGVDWYKQAMQEKARVAKGVRSSRPREQAAESARKTEKYTSRPPKPGAERNSLERAISKYQGELGLRASTMSSEQIQKSILAALKETRESTMKLDWKLERAFWIAIAWGQTLVQQLGWEWVMLETGRGAKSIAVASPSRSHAVVAIQYMERLVKSPDADLTSQLLYSMIVGNAIPSADPGELHLLG